MLIVRDENKLRTPSVCRRGRTASASSLVNSFELKCLVGLKLVRYEPLSGETTTTSGFDGRLFSFLVRATTIAIWSVSKDKRFPMPIWQAGKRVSPV